MKDRHSIIWPHNLKLYNNKTRQSVNLIAQSRRIKTSFDPENIEIFSLVSYFSARGTTMGLMWLLQRKHNKKKQSNSGLEVIIAKIHYGSKESLKIRAHSELYVQCKLLAIFQSHVAIDLWCVVPQLMY